MAGRFGRYRKRTEEDSSVARLINLLNSADSKNVKMSATLKKYSKNECTARVRFSYVAAQDDELNLDEDDVIEVLEEVEDGWARGKLNGRIGLFPTNFVSYSVTPISQQLTYTNAPIRADDSKERNPKHFKPNASKESDELAEKGFPSVKSVRNSFVERAKPAEPLSSVIKSARSLESSISAEKKEYAKVQYDYKAEHPDELDLREGDQIRIVSRRTADEGWFEGELHGRRGVFPENFVRLLPPMASAPTAAASAPTTAAAAANSNAAAAPTTPTEPLVPPTLPAKPAKPLLAAKPSSNGDDANKQNSPTQASAPMVANGTSAAIASKASELVRERQRSAELSPPRAPPYASIEERKSMIAGLQSILFPQGKLPPHKPTFTPPPSALTNSMHAAFNTSSGSASDDNAQNIPPTHLRHSVVDPTRFGAHEPDQKPADANGTQQPQLESLTKFRPKMPNKRPPSSQFRQSKLTAASDSAEPAASESASCARPDDDPASFQQPEPVPVGPSTTAFPSASPQHSPSPASNTPPPTTVSRNSDIHNVVKELASVTSAIKDKQMGSKCSKPTADFVSAADFDDFRAEVLKRLQSLEAKVDKLLLKQ